MFTGTIAPGAIRRRLIGAGSICAVVIMAAWQAAPAVASPRAATVGAHATGWAQEMVTG